MPGHTPAAPVIVQVTGIISTEEQYELVERKALAIDTGGDSYEITTTEPKVVTLIVDNCAMQVDDQAITADSPKLADGVSLSMTLKGKPTTIYGKAVADSGTLYIMVFK